MPGGQYTNLKEQAESMGLGARWHEIARTYAEVNMAFGDIVKVTPSSKVVGDMAIFLVSHDMTMKQFERLTPDHNLTLPQFGDRHVLGSLGEPEGGWPKHAAEDHSARREAAARTSGRAPAPVDLEETGAALEKKIGRKPVARRRAELPDVSGRLPEVRAARRQNWSDVDVLPTPQFFYGMERGPEMTVELEPGKTLVIKFLTVGEPHPDGTRTVFFELNGQPREVTVRDRKLQVTEQAKPKADPDQPGQIGAPIPGVVSTVAVELNQKVKKGDRLLVLEAMKMQSTVYAPVAGTVTQVLVTPGQQVEAKDLLLVIE